MTPAELIENGFDGPVRIHVTKLNGEKIFGSLNIGKLRKTALIRDNKPVYLTESGYLVTSDNKMIERIEERLKQLKMGE